MDHFLACTLGVVLPGLSRHEGGHEDVETAGRRQNAVHFSGRERVVLKCRKSLVTYLPVNSMTLPALDPKEVV